MKTIFHTFIAILIFGIMVMSFTDKTNPKTSILIQSDDSKISSLSLSQSATIISNRLKDFSSEKFEITIIPEKNQIQVTLMNDQDLKTIENLMIQKGTLAFYETYNHKSLAELLKGNDHLFSLFTTANKSSAEIGCTSSMEVEKINDYLNTLGLDQKCKFAWSQHLDSSEVCLYALKTNGDKAALLSGADIESVKSNQDKASKNNEIEIRFKKSSVELWAKVTKHNINNAIAIVLDNNVIAAPVVCSEIAGGHSTITGNYTQAEVRYIAAIGNNGELPVSFKILK